MTCPKVTRPPIPTSDLGKVNKVLENMKVVKPEYYQMLDFKTNCYGWANEVLEKSGIPVR